MKLPIWASVFVFFFSINGTHSFGQEWGHPADWSPKVREREIERDKKIEAKRIFESGNWGIKDQFRLAREALNRELQDMQREQNELSRQSYNLTAYDRSVVSNRISEIVRQLNNLSREEGNALRNRATEIGIYDREIREAEQRLNRAREEARWIERDHQRYIVINGNRYEFDHWVKWYRVLRTAAQTVTVQDQWGRQFLQEQPATETLEIWPLEDRTAAYNTYLAVWELYKGKIIEGTSSWRRVWREGFMDAIARNLEAYQKAEQLILDEPDHLVKERTLHRYRPMREKVEKFVEFHGGKINWYIAHRQDAAHRLLRDHLIAEFKRGHTAAEAATIANNFWIALNNEGLPIANEATVAWSGVAGYSEGLSAEWDRHSVETLLAEERARFAPYGNVEQDFAKQRKDLVLQLENEFIPFLPELRATLTRFKEESERAFREDRFGEHVKKPVRHRYNANLAGREDFMREADKYIRIADNEQSRLMGELYKVVDEAARRGEPPESVRPRLEKIWREGIVRWGEPYKKIRELWSGPNGEKTAWEGYPGVTPELVAEKAKFPLRKRENGFIFEIEPEKADEFITAIDINTPADVADLRTVPVKYLARMNDKRSFSSDGIFGVAMAGKIEVDEKVVTFKPALREKVAEMRTHREHGWLAFFKGTELLSVLRPDNGLSLFKVEYVPEAKGFVVQYKDDRGRPIKAFGWLLDPAANRASDIEDVKVTKERELWTGMLD